MFVDLEPDAAFRRRWHRTATRLGYDVQRPNADASLPDWLAEAWVLRLSGIGEPATRSTDPTTLRGTVTRLLGRLRTRLLGYSDQ